MPPEPQTKKPTKTRAPITQDDAPAEAGIEPTSEWIAACGRHPALLALAVLIRVSPDSDTQPPLIVGTRTCLRRRQSHETLLHCALGRKHRARRAPRALPRARQGPSKSSQAEEAGALRRRAVELITRLRIFCSTPETPTSGKKKGPGKSATKWGDSKLSAADVASYDYSDTAPSSGAATPTKGLVSNDALGKRSKSGLYEVADYATRDDDDDDDDDAPATTSSALSSFLSRLSLSPKALTEADLAPALESMRQHLMSKNVAADIASRVCDGVGKSLVGVKASGFGSVKREVRGALEKSLTKILTPASSTDLLQDITRKRAAATTGAGKSGKANPPPYAITFVGVNGVGKSTNLSKVAFWLLQNRLRVLIAACDTFRSGAVEQLKVHIRNLSALGDQIEGEKGRVELYEKGYGKDAAGIAKEALAYG